MKINPPLLISILLLLVAILMPGNGKIAGNYLDKVAHFSLFLFMTINILHSLIDKKRSTELLLWLVLAGLLSEVIQQFIPGRNMDLYDGIADTLGIMVAFYIYRNNKMKVESILQKLGG